MPSTSVATNAGSLAVFTRVEAQVLEEFDAGREFGESGAHGIHRVLRVGLPLRTPEVAGSDDGGPAFGQPLDGRQRGADAEVVGDPAVVVQRHVEVGAHQHPLAGQVAEVASRSSSVGMAEVSVIAFSA